jgi:hypothetical protein
MVERCAKERERECVVDKSKKKLIIITPPRTTPAVASRTTRPFSR